VLATRTDDPNVNLLILCNAIGAPVVSGFLRVKDFVNGDKYFDPCVYLRIPCNAITVAVVVVV